VVVEDQKTRHGAHYTVLPLVTNRYRKISNGEWHSEFDWHYVQPEGRAHSQAGYVRSGEIEKNGNGLGKKTGAKARIRAWEVRAFRIAKSIVT
jgi:hypothetical protein